MASATSCAGPQVEDLRLALALRARRRFGPEVAPAHDAERPRPPRRFWVAAMMAKATGRLCARRIWRAHAAPSGAAADPDFVAKLRDVVGLYRPAGAIVRSDARSRRSTGRSPVLAPCTRYAASTTLFAALNVRGQGRAAPPPPGVHLAPISRPAGARAFTPTKRCRRCAPGSAAALHLPLRAAAPGCRRFAKRSGADMAPSTGSTRPTALHLDRRSRHNHRAGGHSSVRSLGAGKGVFFRLSAGPLADMAAAEALCGKLMRRSLYCAPLVF